MFGLGYIFAEWEEQTRYATHTLEKIERQRYDLSVLRGPMIEADIDWRVPCPRRTMEEGDL